MMRNKWFLNMVNPNFFYDYQKMFNERSPKDHENYVDRLLNTDDRRLKQNTYDTIVKNELEQELHTFLQLRRTKKF